jgi:hypothetical protein
MATARFLFEKHMNINHSHDATIVVPPHDGMKSMQRAFIGGDQYERHVDITIVTRTNTTILSICSDKLKKVFMVVCKIIFELNKYLYTCKPKNYYSGHETCSENVS